MYGHKKPTVNGNHGNHTNNHNNHNDNYNDTGLAHSRHNGHVEIIDKNTKDQINKTIRGSDKTTRLEDKTTRLGDKTTRLENKTMRGDLSQWNEAKRGREKRVKDRQAKRDKMAQVCDTNYILQGRNQNSPWGGDMRAPTLIGGRGATTSDTGPFGDDIKRKKVEWLMAQLSAG